MVTPSRGSRGDSSITAEVSEVGFCEGSLYRMQAGPIGDTIFRAMENAR